MDHDVDLENTIKNAILSTEIGKDINLRIMGAPTKYKLEYGAYGAYGAISFTLPMGSTLTYTVGSKAPDVTIEIEEVDETTVRLIDK